jgi:hypothetical protein
MGFVAGHRSINRRDGPARAVLPGRTAPAPAADRSGSLRQLWLRRSQRGAFAQTFGFAALLFLLTLYLQNILGYSPLQAGFVFLAFSAVLAIVDSFAGRLAASVGSRLPMAAGMALCAVAFLLLLVLTPTSGLALVILALLVAGVDQAFAYTVSTTGGMQAIPEAKAGAASGILSMIRLVGAVFGVAVTGALFKARENDRVAGLLAASGANLDASECAEIRGYYRDQWPPRTSSPDANRTLPRRSSRWCAKRSCTHSTALCSCAWQCRRPAFCWLSWWPARVRGRSAPLAPPPRALYPGLDNPSIWFSDDGPPHGSASLACAPRSSFSPFATSPLRAVLPASAFFLS